MFRRATALGGAVVAAAVLAACADSGTTITGVSDTAASLTITVEGQLGTPPGGAPLALEVGDAATLAATAINALGLAVPGVAANWSSSAPTVVQVDPSGAVEALSAGSADVMASVSGAAATIRVVVSDTVTVPVPAPPSPGA